MYRNVLKFVYAFANSSRRLRKGKDLELVRSLNVMWSVAPQVVAWVIALMTWTATARALWVAAS